MRAVTRPLKPYGAAILGLSIAAAIALCLATGSSNAQGKGGGAGTPPPIPTTPDDFHQKGTPILGAGLSTPIEPILSANDCTVCHAYYGEQDPFLVNEPYQPWVASMMGQSGRDPLFYAGLTIANQDAEGAGEYCMRCHVPVGWLNGHASPSDGSSLDDLDREGVQCNFCHRLIDPDFKRGISPDEDDAVLTELASLDLLPPEGNNSRFTFDPADSRRGPFDDIAMNIHPGNPQPQIIHSPFHSTAEFCWNCHGVSNVLMLKQPDGTYALDPLGSPHSTGAQVDMFPLHRTYSEWKNSYYSTIGVDHTGRFGGNHPTGIMKVCQDCHMPDQVGYGCSLQGDPFVERPDVPQHSFIGSNNWVLNAIRTVDADGDSVPDFPDSVTGLSDSSVAAALARNVDFLEKASDVVVTRQGQTLKVRLLNRAGHKLPTGFPDGRRIWINVKFFDCNDALLTEHGSYDFKTAALDAASTKVYEMLLAIDGAEYAASIGRPEGQTFHFMLANKILKDNRIPPAGYFAQVAQQNQTAPVGATYANGQHWDDTLFTIPPDVTKIVTTVYYQLASREFIEHLRDDNVTDNRGQVAYDLWVEHGMSPPVVMDSHEIVYYKPADVTQDGTVNVNDLLAVIAAWGACPPPPEACPADISGDGFVNVVDLLATIASWGPC